MNYSTSFILDRAHLTECYDQSLPHSPKKRLRVEFIVATLGAGIALLAYSDVAGFFPSLLIGLGVIELLSFYFRRPWWLARQLLSRSANCEVLLSVNDKGVNSHTPLGDTQLLWREIKKLIDTPKGIILETQQGGQSYLSKSVLNNDVLAYIQGQL
tara:strand:- start:811 stop:1278 length:468 start_codon:yes stop_codon:yes gene_type:complete